MPPSGHSAEFIALRNVVIATQLNAARQTPNPENQIQPCRTHLSYAYSADSMLISKLG